MRDRFIPETIGSRSDRVPGGGAVADSGTFVLAVCEYLDALERIRETTLAASR